MNYSKLQKITSGSIIFVLLFSITFRIPFFNLFNKVSAEDKDFYNIVSIIVNEDIYNSVSAEVERYAKDIQWVLENTRAVILPVPSDTKAFNIASLNESLYFEWYKSLEDSSFESRLIWTVLVWNLPIPIVSDNGKTAKSIVPYTDFEDKSYIYDHETGIFQKNNDVQDVLRAEIWHWVISPNNWDRTKDIIDIKWYFDKNHDFYEGTWNFEIENGILNWNIKEGAPEDYEPFVFYFDQFREEKAIHYPDYKWYLAYLDNKEDLTYFRYNNALADSITDTITSAQNDEIYDLMEKLDIENSDNYGDNSWTDITSRFFINELTSKFIEIFNVWQIDDFKTNVHNAWRYNWEGSEVNVDMIPYLISVLDATSDEIMKSSSNDLENIIDWLVLDGLSRKIAVPTKITFSNPNNFTFKSDYVYNEYTNFLFWKQGNDIEKAEECSIYRGSTADGWILVEANRGSNIKNIQADISKCLDKTSWYWWGNSPVNLNIAKSSEWILELNSSRDVKKSIVPLFDILWAKRTEDESKVYSPLNCFDNNFLITKLVNYHGTTIGAPINWNPAILNWSYTNRCDKENISFAFTNDFQSVYNSIKYGSTHDQYWCFIDQNLYLDEKLLPIWTSGTYIGTYTWCLNVEHNYYFKTIDSEITHKSPTSFELINEIKNPVTSNLPIDIIRYIDFIWIDWKYKKIEYPGMFDLLWDSNNSLESYDQLLDVYLDAKSLEINNYLKGNNTSLLNGDELAVYNLLKKWNYSNVEIDLKSALKDEPFKNIDIWWEQKTISYYSFLKFSIYWNNLTNISSKYKFVIENYLSDQIWGNDFDFILPKNKKEYEVAYLWAIWDTQNMYIKMDPEEKEEDSSVYDDIYSDNSLLDGDLMSLRVLNNTSIDDVNILEWGTIWGVNGEPIFKCAPPDWVPIWEWMSAVKCWLDDMLPPTISISEWDCWESLMTEEERLEIEEFEAKNNYDSDVNDNWINDYLEDKFIWASLNLSSDKEKYFYDSIWKLNVVLEDSNWKIVIVDSSSYVDISLSRIVDIEEGKTVFNSSIEDFDDNIELIEEYTLFQNFRTRLNNWEANYAFWVKNIDSDLYFEATLVRTDDKGNEVISIESNIIKVSIRGGNLFINSSRLKEWEIYLWEDIISASKSNNIYLYEENTVDLDSLKSLWWDRLLLGLSNISKTWEQLDLSFPLELKVYDRLWDSIYESSINSLWGFEPVYSNTIAWNYKIEITDNDGFKVSKDFDIVAGIPTNLDIKLWSSVLEKGWALTTNIVTIYDEYDNPVTWEFLDIDLKILGDSILFAENNEKNLSFNTIEWFRAFRLLSTDQASISRLQVDVSIEGEKVLSSFENIRVVNEMILDIKTSGVLKVWNDVYSLFISLKDENGSLISDLDSRIYLSSGEKYGSTLIPYTDLNWGKATVLFQTFYLAWKEIPFEFQIEGLKNIYKDFLTIYPEEALKIDLKATKSNLEASFDSSTFIKVELKDVYWNLVFNDNKTRVDIEILDEYKDIISTSTNWQVVSEWKAIFKVNATDMPWSSYVKVLTTPSLENNTFEIIGQAPFLKEKLDDISFVVDDSGLSDIWKKIFYEVDDENYRFLFNSLDALENNTDFLSLPEVTRDKIIKLWGETNVFYINWVWENVIEINTYYFWKKEFIEGNKYNSIYTALLGSSYWDFTEKDYLAWALLFDKGNRSLAVSSLINNPYEYNDILQISWNSAITKVYNNSDLTQDIDIKLSFDKDNIAYLDLFNNSLTTYIWKIFFNFSDKNKLNICDSSDCFDEEETSIAIIEWNTSYIYENLWDELIIRDYSNKKLLTIDESWKITRTSGISLELNESVNTNAIFDIKNGNEIIWKLGFNFIDSDLKFARDENTISGLLASSKNSIIIKLDTDDYSVRDISTVWDIQQKAIYYNDPFSKEYTLNSLSKENIYSFDNFATEEGLWWKGWNKAMLDFAAWKNVWEAVKDYASVWLINLWDPVIYLKKIREKIPNTTKDRKFDRTIWKKINTEKIEYYRIFDYDNDEKEDLLFIENNNYLKLLENKDIHNNLLDQKYLANIFDLWDKKLIQAWDFTWDGYDDIFFINNKGWAFLLNNIEKDFTRFSLEDQFSLDWTIIKTEGFDMDNDGKFDIVTLDDNGSINIFYWWGSSISPNFTKKLISEGSGIEIDNNSRDSLGVVYFDWVPQLEENWDNSEFISEVENFNNSIDSALSVWDINRLNNLVEGNVSEVINESLADSFIFEQVPYNSLSDISKVGIEEPSWSITDNIIRISSSEISSSVNDTISGLDEFILENDIYINSLESNEVPQTTFIKNIYSSSLWLDTKVYYKDINWWFLKWGDIVSVEVILKNTSSRTLENIAYLESIPSYFVLDESSLENTLWIPFRQGINNYDFLLDNFSLWSGKSITIKYDLVSKSISFSHIEVGVFEQWEVWYDPYGDIIVKASEENCSEDVDIFRSESSRTYVKGIKEIECNIEKLELPDELEQNKLDADWDWIPDYIEELSEGINQDYINDIENTLYVDTDWDGIPDSEDISPNIWEESFLGDLDSINESVDKISEGIDALIDWFGCWFGWGACITTPLNRAPLAPGNDLVFMWMLIWDWLKVEEWLPYFSSLTGVPTSTWCVPSVWPVSSLSFPTCSWLWAWGRLWTNSAANTIRLFYTPTLTWAHWFAACYWWPASTAWRVPPMGVSPLLPGWNCIVTAFPMDFCSWDWNDWDPASLGVVTYMWWESLDNWTNVWVWWLTWSSFWIISWNCTGWWTDNISVDNNKLDNDFINDYLSFKETWIAPNGLSESFETVFWESGEVNYGLWEIDPLIWVSWEDWSLFEIQVDLSLWSINEWNFEDVSQVENTRIAPFPDFLMKWITNQLDEIIQKLTDFPTLFIIMPDFSWLYNADWKNYVNNWVEEAYNEWVEEESERVEKLDIQIAELQTEINDRCTWEDIDKLDCGILQLKVNDLEAKKWYWLSKQYSWIQQAYEFLSSVPIIQIESETIKINIPWIDETSLEKTIISWKETLAQRKEEFSNISEYLDYDPDEIVKISKLLASLERNIQTLEDYKNFPERLSTLVNKKQDRLDQILCNIESISYILWGRIWKNWIRFRTWVELYVLIKAILKSWQLLADIFIDYDAECHECKNERRDSIGWQFSIISAIIPPIPHIEFPKWPDIILDLHNIRVDLVIYIPDFKFNLRPIVLPNLPKIYLPERPDIKIKFPSIPRLPIFYIPELPDIPTLPKVELPNLPPPPKLPKIFASLEWILDILKLVTKAMCILKKSPLVPEWRAWDQIAFLTERSWYLPFDFLSIIAPNFTYPFVDAVEVITYVNLEFETEFLIEMARVISLPLNSFTSNTRRLFRVEDIDLSGAGPDDIEIDIKIDWSIGNVEIERTEFAKMFVFWIWKLINHLNDNKNKEVSSKEFVQLINKELSKKSIISNPKMDDIRELWAKVNDMTYSKEDELISNLLETHYDKFNAVKAIINTESEKNRSLKFDIENSSSSSIFKEISKNDNDDFEAYNKSLYKYNLDFVNAANNLIQPRNFQKEELTKMWDNILAGVDLDINPKKISKNNLLAETNSSITSSFATNECAELNSSEYSYNYEGIYILEEWESYRLFDYLDWLDWKEEVTSIDIDWDKDLDLLYMVSWDLYLKENLENTPYKTYVTWSALKVSSSSNKFVNGDDFYEAINNFWELTISDSAVNLSFSSANRQDIDNYRLEYFTIIDKYQNEDNPNYSTENIKKNIVDSFAGHIDSSLLEETEDYSLRENIWKIDYVWMVSWVKMYTKELKVLNEDLNNNEFVYISSNTTLYAWNSNIYISYLDWEEQKGVSIPKYSNINFNRQVKIYKIGWGDAYVLLDDDLVLEWSEISTYIGLPLPFETRIEVIDDSRLTTNSHIDISYYEDSEIWIDFRDVNSYEFYDLGYKSNDYLIRLEVENDYLYSRIYALQDDLIWTKSNQVLLAPQIESDLIAPELNFRGTIEIPIYQKIPVDFSEYLYEASGIDDIVDISLTGIPDDKYTVDRSPWKVRIEFGEFDEMFESKLDFTLIDENWNIWTDSIDFEVYTPTPEIASYTDWYIKGAIDEEITDMPITLYRIRWGSIKRLTNDVTMTTEWIFNFEVPEEDTQTLSFQSDWEKVFSVNEETWKIGDEVPLDNIEVKISDEDYIPTIIVSNDIGESIFYEKIILDWENDIILVDSFKDIDADGLYVNILNKADFAYYIIPEWVPYNPWALVIYRQADVNKEPLFVIFKDGRIDTINDSYTLEYTSYDDYVVFKLIDGHYDEEVARVLYKVNTIYLIR